MENQGDGGLVERGTMRTSVPKVGPHISVVRQKRKAEVVDVLQLLFWRLDRSHS